MVEEVNVSHRGELSYGQPGGRTGRVEVCGLAEYPILGDGGAGERCHVGA